MDGLGSGYTFGQGDLEFPPPDGQLSGHGGSISSFSPSLHLSYPHIQHGGATLRDSVFTSQSHSGRTSLGDDTFQMSRFPMGIPPEPAIRGVSGIPTPDFNHIIPRHHLVSPHSPPPALPHISSFGETAYLSSDRPAVPQVSLNDHPTFGSIMASAVSNISTMNIPQPYISAQSGTRTDSQVADVTLPRLRGEDSSLAYNPVHGDTSQTQPFIHHFTGSSGSEAIPSLSSLASYSQPIHSQSFSRQVTSTRASPLTSRHGSSLLPEQPLLTSRPTSSQTLPVENHDGDQQVPNAVMSPASGCSSPNIIRSSSTPDTRSNSLLRQVITHDSLQLQVAQTDNMSTLHNEMSFANSTYLGGELCTESGQNSGKFVASTVISKRSSPESYSNQRSTSGQSDTVSEPVAGSSGLGSSSNSSHSSPRCRQSPRRCRDKSNVSYTQVSNEVNPSTCKLVHNDEMETDNKQNTRSLKVMKRLEFVVEEKEAESKENFDNDELRSSNIHKHVLFFKMGNLWRKRKRRRNVPLHVPLDISVTSEDEDDVDEEDIEEENFESVSHDREDSVVKQEDASPRYGEQDSDQQFIRTSQPVFSRNSEELEDVLSLPSSNSLMDKHPALEDYDSYEGRASRRKTKRQFHHTEEASGDNGCVNMDENKNLNFSDDYLLNCTKEVVTAAMADYPVEESETNKRFTKLNPFAITSPSFSKSAARAIMTTSVAHNATVITISIMGKGNASKPGKTKTININKGVIMSTSFEDRPEKVRKDSISDEQSDGAVGMQTTSIMSRLKRDADDTGVQENEFEDVVETMEVNVRIDDSQLVQHGEHKRWQCHLCAKSYTTKHNLVAHILDHNNIKPHLCMVCGKYFKQLSHLNTHMLTHDNIRPHKCNICGKGFTQISHLKRHTAVHLDSKPYKCDVCSRGFAYPSELRAHKEKHVQGHDKCDECGMEFDSPRALKLHLLKHDNREDLVCKYCDKVFRYPSQLKDHMVSHEGTRPYICGECGMDFMKEHHLKAHQFTHTGQRPFDCPKCGRTFNQRANMMRHMLIHNPTRAFRCDVCGKTFTQPQTLKAHRVVHADIKPHKCKICGKQFGRLHNLQGHIHMHNNSKPYVCFCGSSFTLKGNLNRHKKVKHGLNESTESLEEQAVSFLSSLSGRSQTDDADTYIDYNEFELDIEQTATTSDQRTPRKGRKSVVPRKIMRRRSSAGKAEVTEESDQEEGEEEEGEEDYGGDQVSGYFGDFKSEQDPHSFVSNLVETTESQQKSLRKRKVPNRVSRVDENPAELSSEMSEGQEDASDSEWRPSSRPSRVGKGAKLDSIIAEKFKTV